VLSTPPVQVPTLEQLEQLGQDQRSRILSNLGLQKVDELRKDLRNSKAETEKKVNQMAKQREAVRGIIEMKKKQESEVQEKIKALESELAALEKQREDLKLNEDALERQAETLKGNLSKMDLKQGELGSGLQAAKDLFKKLLTKEAEEGSEQLANMDAETSLAKEQEEQSKLEEVLEQRRKLLGALEAQPEWFAYLAAFGASVGATFIMHPIDTLKTRLVGANKNEHGESPPMPSLAELPSLYDGLVGNLAKEGPSSALYLGVYETVKVQLEATPLASNLLAVYLLAGGAGELVGSVVRAPAEAVKSRLQMGRDSSVVESIQQVFSDQGRATIVRAWSASCFRDVPAGAIQIAIFELAKVYIVSRPSIAVGIDVNSLLFEALLGASAGGIAAFLTTPADVITTQIITKSKSSTSHGSGSSTGQATEDKADGNFLERLIQNYEQGGLEALFLGWKERTAYWTPAIGLFLSFYCTVRQAAIAQDLFGNY